MSYVQRIIDQVKAKDPDQPEFIQAVTEVMSTLEPVIEAHPEYEEAKLARAHRRARAHHPVPRSVG